MGAVGVWYFLIRVLNAAIDIATIFTLEQV